MCPKSAHTPRGANFSSFCIARFDHHREVAHHFHRQGHAKSGNWHHHCHQNGDLPISSAGQGLTSKHLTQAALNGRGLTFAVCLREYARLQNHSPIPMSILNTCRACFDHSFLTVLVSSLCRGTEADNAMATAREKSTKRSPMPSRNRWVSCTS